MSLSENLKIDVLKTLMQEDRTEARIIRARIETVVWSIVVASFAITAFWLKPPSQAGYLLRWIVLLSDVSLLLAIIIVFSRSKRDLRYHRMAQKARQDLFLQIANGSNVKFDPFPDVRQIKAYLKDRDMFWILSAAIGLMLLKTVVSFFLFACSNSHFNHFASTCCG